MAVDFTPPAMKSRKSLLMGREVSDPNPSGLLMGREVRMKVRLELRVRLKIRLWLRFRLGGVGVDQF